MTNDEITSPPDPIARLRDVVKYQPNFRGSRNDLLFLLDTITELQDDSDVESVRHALQTSEAHVDRLTKDVAQLHIERDDLNASLQHALDTCVPIAELKEAEARVDRLTAALRAVEWGYQDRHDYWRCPSCDALKMNREHRTNCGLAAALADPGVTP